MIWRCDLLPQYELYKKEIDEAMLRVLHSGVYILGKEVAAFEQEFAKYVGCQFGVGVANATDALTLSLTALGVGHGDEVITTPFTAIPTVSAIVDAGATPVFVDICPDTYLMNLDQVAAKITSRTKAIMPVHIFGNVLDIPKLKQISGSIPIIEDASQAHGSTIRGKQAGSMGDLSVFSFYPTKNLGGYGDGGAVLANSESHSKKLKLLRMYGMTDKDHIVINGINSRLDELQAAILKIKLKHLDEMNRKRVQIANRYIERLRPGLFEFQKIPSETVSNFHIFNARFKGNRKKFMEYMDTQKIQTNIYYLVPLHLQEANRSYGYKLGDLPVCEKLCEESIALPMYPELDEKTQNFIISKINEFKEAN